MFGFGHQAEEIDDVDEANLQVGAVLAQNGGGGEGFRGGNIASAGDDDIGLGAGIGGGPVPDADALRAVPDGLVYAEVLKVGRLVGDDDVDVVSAAQAVIGD